MREDKTKIYDILDLKNQPDKKTILKIWKEGYRAICILDTEQGEDYKIYLSNSREFKIQGRCFLNGQSSFEADFNGLCPGNDMALTSVINGIAGGEIITPEGCLIGT